MFVNSILSFFCSICATRALWITPKMPPVIDIATEMKKAGIVPKILPEAPLALLNVTLTRGRLIPGTMLDHLDDETGPRIYFQASETEWHAVFISVVQNWDPEQKIVSRSPNATYPPYQQEEWHQWVVVNIPGNNVSLGEQYYEFKQPDLDGDEEIVNLEMYLLYKQPCKMVFKRPYEATLGNYTVMKSVHEITTHYNMTGPIAGNFLYRQWTEIDNTMPSKMFDSC